MKLTIRWAASRNENDDEDENSALHPTPYTLPYTYINMGYGVWVMGYGVIGYGLWVMGDGVNN